MKRQLVLVNSYINFELNNLKFAQATQFRENLKKIKISKNLNASIGFGQIQYQRSLIDVLYLWAFLGR